jgi:phosphoglucosamine mutase
MTRRLFGTDGIRGQANSEPMTAQTALKAAMAAALHFRRGEHRHTVLIGKDTRLSGYMLEPAMTAGFIAMGMNVILLGPIPTPAVAMLTRSMRADLGVMLSASHNPFQDNGIKLFGPDGYKLSDEIEAAIEARMDAPFDSDLAAPVELGRASRMDDANGRYIEMAKSSFPRDLRLDGMRIVIDCAHGAAYKAAPRILYELGADVMALHVAPDGMNINRGCGATSVETMRAAVIAHKADLGLALDGDADRLMIADEAGAIIDGDQIMGAIAAHWAQAGRLRGGGIAATVMSNMGLELFLQEHGLALERTGVGDRYVVERMRERGLNLGGEQSGHVVMSDFATTGDGMLAALQVLVVLLHKGRPASQALRVFEPMPQLLKNVRYDPLMTAKPLDAPAVQKAIRDGEAALVGKGRLLIRKSGTEPLIRVMAEGHESATVTSAVDRICDALRVAVGAR